ncbi:cytochrome c3 family protein [Roseovarius sp. E0-M6]|uniref:cytochrome c3 family protein n=1 Tax=Roseovarius sp. E0-M6 TaxID=3127118 RepID=UPI00301034F4
MAALLGLWGHGADALEASKDTHPLLAEMGIPVTFGAAAGYVPDAVCADCHADKAETFAEMGMARSFYRPSREKVIEDFGAMPFHHEPSDRYYEMELRDGDYWFQRYGLTAEGARIDGFSVKVDWILGSGNHSRIYLYQTPDGALFQLPISWYTQSQTWAMAPGYEFKQHFGVLRAVPPRCMACHNGFADYPQKSGLPGYPWTYPTDLPEGIGCQRCHGPGAEHVRRGFSGEGGVADLRAAIVQPGKLEDEKLYGICYGCHMQPTVTVNSPLRLGRGHFSFRPGEDIEAFVMQLDITDPNMPKPERFEINHHPYRMKQSACYTQGEGELGCLSCHDPHVKIKPKARAAHYRKACLSCHETDDRGLPRMTTAGAAHPTITQEDDCTACHMPERRTQDVVEVWMTDHKITRRADPLAERLAPIPSVNAEVSDIYLHDPEADVATDEALILKLVSILQYSGDRAGYAATDLGEVLARSGNRDLAPWVRLMEAYVRQDRWTEAHAVSNRALSIDPDNPSLLGNTAMASFAMGEHAEGIDAIRERLSRDPELVELRFKLVRLLAIAGHADDAMTEAETLLQYRPNHMQTWRLLGTLAMQGGDQELAIRAYLNTLELEPDAQKVRATAAQLLRAKGRADAADRHEGQLSR